MKAAVALALVLVAAPACAEEPTPLRWRTHEAIPARITDALVPVQIGRAVVEAWRAPDRRHALGCVALRNVLAIAASEALKRAIGRRRPDGRDALSFPSGHTATAAVNTARGWSAGLTVGVALGRQAAGRHYATDVAGGLFIGALAQRACTP